MASLMLSRSQRTSLEEACQAYEKNRAKVAPYLESRGIHEQAAGVFRLGFVDDPQSGHEQYAGRLAIPYLTPAGPVAFRFRCVAGHDCKQHGHAKYIQPPGQALRLFNVHDLFTREPYVAVTEGELDAVTLSLCGIPAVGVPGASSWRRYYRRLLEDFDRVYVFCDGDKAGRDFGQRLANELEHAVLLHCDDGEDVNSLYCHRGRDALWSMLGIGGSSA